MANIYESDKSNPTIPGQLVAAAERWVKPWTGAFGEALSKEEILAMVSPFIRQRA